jgi:ABC-type phosphate transport system ATPase subunit
VLQQGPLTLGCCDEVELAEGTGLLVEFDRTDTLFTRPADRRTEDYVTGRFG